MVRCGFRKMSSISELFTPNGTNTLEKSFIFIFLWLTINRKLAPDYSIIHYRKGWHLSCEEKTMDRFSLAFSNQGGYMKGKWEQKATEEMESGQLRLEHWAASALSSCCGSKGSRGHKKKEQRLRISWLVNFRNTFHWVAPHYFSEVAYAAS